MNDGNEKIWKEMWFWRWLDIESLSRNMTKVKKGTRWRQEGEKKERNDERKSKRRWFTLTSGDESNEWIDKINEEDLFKRRNREGNIGKKVEKEKKKENRNAKIKHVAIN